MLLAFGVGLIAILYPFCQVGNGPTEVGDDERERGESLQHPSHDQSHHGNTEVHLKADHGAETVIFIGFLIHGSTGVYVDRQIVDGHTLIKGVEQFMI